MESYNEKIAENPKAELIHMSRDTSEDAAKEWAVKESMPWPTLMSDDQDVDALIAPYFPDGSMGVPTYILVDRTGKELARGKEAAFAQIAKATK